MGMNPSVCIPVPWAVDEAYPSSKRAGSPSACVSANRMGLGRRHVNDIHAFIGGSLSSRDASRFAQDSRLQQLNGSREHYTPHSNGNITPCADVTLMVNAERPHHRH